MAEEKAQGLVIRTNDWSETSRIATVFTRELGKVRVLAKGGRRLRSSFESALDLLTVCRIVWLRKASGLDLLTEARVEERFPGLRARLPALYAAYYVAELLAAGTQDYDPHPTLYDAAVAALRDLSGKETDPALRTIQFELAWLHELGYQPRLDSCAVCSASDWLENVGRFSFGSTAGGVLCPRCEPAQRDRRALSIPAWRTLRTLVAGSSERPPAMVAAELRQLLGHHVSSVLGHRPQLLAYLE
jgi:DNA repair protein RecO (recombination protein O)